MRPSKIQLAAVDEANLVLDHDGQVNVFLVAGLLERGGFIRRDGRPDLAALRTVLDRRIAALPSLRRVPVLSGRRHHWVEVSPDLEQHIRLVDPVDGLFGLEQLCGRLMTTPLCLNRPPWELLVVPGASARSVGFVLRIHHALADGMAAVGIVHQLFARESEVSPLDSRTVLPPVTAPPPALSAQQGKHPLRRVRRITFGLRRILTTLFGGHGGQTVLLGDRGPERGVVFVDADLRPLNARVRPLGMTVNDALLAATAAGYAAALAAVHEPIPADLRVSIPVALRRRGTSGNQVGVMLVRLPLGVLDPDSRLRLIADQTRIEKERARDQGTLEFMRGPRGARIMDRIGRRQRLVAGFVTNVPGPPSRMYLAGAPVVAIWPVAVLAANVRLGVAAASYAGRLWCSVHFDETSVPGAVFAQAMKGEFTRLAGDPGADAPR
ncbi:MAG: wax ester/triacylglycerol synthase domain-containing protein [Mycetocola sp.]